MQGKKVLLISTQLPYPPKSGGTVKTWNFVQHLAKKNSLTLACLLKADDQQHEAEMQKLVQLENYISEPLSIARNGLNLLKSYVKSPCLNAYRNYSPAFEAKIHAAIEACDLLIVDHYEMFQYVPAHFSGKLVIHTHNAEYLLWRRMAELESNLLLKAALKIESIRVKRHEEQMFKQADLVFSTPSDIALYQQEGMAIQKHRITYHLGNDELLQLPQLDFKETEKALCFIGTLSWQPNIDGLHWFIEKVWPIIKQSEPEIKLYVLGKDPDERLLQVAKNEPNIDFVGFVKDLDSYLKKTRVYLAPLRFGSGMKVKVLEGLYRGVPSVITPVAAEGLEIANGIHALVEEEEEAYASGCLQLLSNQKKWEAMRDEARKLAAEKYKWSDLFMQMDEDMSQLFTGK